MDFFPGRRTDHKTPLPVIPPSASYTGGLPLPPLAEYHPGGACIRSELIADPYAVIADLVKYIHLLRREASTPELQELEQQLQRQGIDLR